MKALDNGRSSNGRYSGNPGLQQVGHKGSQVREGEEDIHLEKVESEITICDFPVGCPKRALPTIFRALGTQNGKYTFGMRPRRSDGPAEPSAPRSPFVHKFVGI